MGMRSFGCEFSSWCGYAVGASGVLAFFLNDWRKGVFVLYRVSGFAISACACGRTEPGLHFLYSCRLVHSNRTRQ